ncbi:tripartite tricarboxylate transporter substrate binding protein [Verminephrobacter aporrectodeae subsp. tuberculatae]|uniref:Bug family tripartite tricarboxylate transporter substrate binding protein n=1 Tax=Verminephrobacter aporrectodeae TaxID=1110389 RepID=UPI002237BEF7|nr:tripartite tricarboxylate transporter substrate binding protein [Verminephrobacter aporrectodeae]MCW5221367.1 tripartite tricarboxylate transporter substrate binding protein [Verminephrobacter aporrectodeae subsp. tuberculatae]MCW5257678.1 tripartite tricarboxylate transporter substrate binding protein [Verminephrobacter aporrectodeae subsp. tuberculatae]MCW5290658.1 tripartite tricarboxylate transporter substrate binding protein [Verminephrobacter aporrectodeae subsp. tuberculatae]MCW816727
MQKTTRKRSTRLLATAALAAALCSSAGAQSAYPGRTVTLVVPTAASGTTDFSARMLAQALAPVLGQSVVVDNRGGGSGSIAASAVKSAKADGYTLLMQYSGFHVISPHITKQKQWEHADFQPVANVISTPQIIVLRSDLPMQTLAELIAYAKANPGRLNYASSGAGSLQHVTGGMLEQQAGIKMTHVPYSKGTGPALQDLLGGQVDLTFGTAPSFLPHVASGKLRVLAVTGKERLPSLPDVPTTAEVGYPQVNASSWFAVFAPAAVPRPVIDRLTADIRTVVQSPAFRQKAQEQGITADYQNPQQLGDKVRADLANWAPIVKALHLKVE